jgi:hypothetical protein
MIFGYFGLAVAFYFSYGLHHSVGNNTGWAALMRRSRDFFCIEGDESRVTLEDQLIRKYLMSADLLEGDDRPGNSDLSGSLLRPSRDNKN